MREDTSAAMVYNEKLVVELRFFDLKNDAVNIKDKYPLLKKANIYI